jgi:hypothetical protein
MDVAPVATPSGRRRLVTVPSADRGVGNTMIIRFGELIFCSTVPNVKRLLSAVVAHLTARSRSTPFRGALPASHRGMEQYAASR